MKTVYGWVVDWGTYRTPRVSIDLFFSSKEKFKELIGDTKVAADNRQLVPIKVPDDFDDLDCIPDNY